MDTNRTATNTMVGKTSFFIYLFDRFPLCAFESFICSAVLGFSNSLSLLEQKHLHI